ncbi:nickel-dependent hydrogenase large subunit [Methylotuvimicrobium alcaliphilum]|uniref:Nickel-dependent hydrogenase large subunit n=1 Tax=Methylotuvimicrobium alcaliphilum (strain DSM 19304 / NCIMB 14124 / VKM B-2133 / 20Z) TaxID=1091494 RepID=G4SY72_META2|nr:nickel-dependent hydrogenase large subunit [Methylotuvimicrobium alcaliphilum]CCE25381.1 Nickel-dependent hydrogenase large subunit [Methylotuvimicrobium alcaliphilum 20Z]
MATIEVNINLNRVEGDLEIALVLDDGVVTEARTVGTLYRGFEQIMMGRAPRDALVITPRVCGICGTAHLYSAVLALEHAWRTPVPPNATRIRNLCLIAEGIQNDLRQTFLFFAPDFCHRRYSQHSWFDDAVDAFEPFRGSIYLETLAQTRKAVEIVAHFGGQWPHSSYMIPGGVTTPADLRRLLACRSVLDEIQRWYERRVIGASLDDWLALEDAERYFAWLDTPAHAGSALGLMSRAARSLGLHLCASGTPHMLSYGAWCDPDSWSAPHDARVLPGGFYDGGSGTVGPYDQQLINEHVRHSWFRPYDGGRHPWNGETVPDFQPNSDRYTWAKAPRYGDKVVQTGPVAELLIGGDALIASLHQAEGGSAWLRQFARVRRIAVELKQARLILDELTANLHEPHILNPAKTQETDGEGYGLIMAARGALGHWLKIKDGVIEKYQIITPTAWNASPRDSGGLPGHWEQSLVGLSVQDPDDPVEIGHVIRSHDPCLVCTVHVLNTGTRLRFGP